MNALPFDPLLRALTTNAVNSAALLVIVALLVLALRNRSPHLRHALWTIVLLRLVMPPSFDLSIPALRMLPGMEASSSVAGALAITGTPLASLHSPLPQVRLFMLALWLSGMAAVAVTLYRSRRSICRLAREARAVDEPAVLRAFHRAKERLGIRRRVDLVTGSEDVGAFTIGTVRPVVFLPRTLISRLSEESLQCVLTHELVHVQRFDDLDRQFQAILQTVYFFNPVVWIAGALRSRENELVCDTIAIAHGSLEPSVYGRGILDVLRLDAATVPHAPMFIGRRKTMTRRIESIFNARPVSRALTAAVMIIGVVLLPAFGEEPLRVEGDVVAPTILNKVMPVYPADARAQGLEGISVLLATIDVTGAVVEVEAVESTREDFTASAMDAVRQWTFKPATLEGKPVAVKYTLTIRFRLDDKKEK